MKRFASQLRNKKSFRFIVISTRIFLGIIFLTAGLSKLIDFPGIIGPAWLVKKAAEYGLGFFARFVAFSEAIVGAILLSRFATLGAVMLFPMLLCILMFTVSLGWRGTPFVNSFLLLLNIGILLYDWPKLKFLFTDQVESIEKIPFERKLPKLDVIWIAGLAVFIAGMFLLRNAVTFKYLIYLGLFVMLIIPLATKWFVSQKD